MVKFKYVKYVLLVILLIMFGLVVLFFNNNNRINNETVTVVDDNEDSNYLYEATSDPYSILVTILNDEKDKIERLPLTKDLIVKYQTERLNSDNRFVSFYQYHTNDGTWYNIRELKDNEYEIYADGKQDDKYALIYRMDIDKYLVKNIQLVETIQLSDTNGEPTEESKYIIDETNYEWLLRVAMYPQEYDEATKRVYGIPSEITRRNIGLTDNFIKKYGYEEDIIKYDTKIGFRPEKGSNFSDNIFVFSIIKDYQNKEIKYKYKFYLDSKNYLDDVELIDQNEILLNNIEKLKYDSQILEYALVKNSDWSICPFSVKFLSKYSNTVGLLADYDIESIKLVERIDKTKVKINEHKLIRKIITKDNNTIIGLFSFLWNDKNEVDDILVYIIPKNRMDLSYEEMYQLAFN